MLNPTNANNSTTIKRTTGLESMDDDSLVRLVLEDGKKFANLKEEEEEEGGEEAEEEGKMSATEFCPVDELEANGFKLMIIFLYNKFKKIKQIKHLFQC